MFFEVAICLYLCSPLVRVSLLFKYVFGSIVTCLLMFFKTQGFIKRNIHGCTQKVKQHTFTTMVRPTLEYASTCWDPHSKDQIEDIEQVQK
jgi:hypothetical protein